MMTLTSYITFIKAHEKLIIIVLAAFLLFRTGQGIENIYFRRDSQIAQQATAKVNTDASSNKTLDDQLVAAKAQQDAAFQQLNQSIVDATTKLRAQQAADAEATQQQILDRWKLLLPMKPGAVQSNGATDQITPEAATDTVKALEQIPVLQLQVNDLNAKLVIDDSIIGKQDDLITGLNKQIADEKASHIADVNLEKVKSRHSFLRGFKYGFVAGAVAVEGIRVWAGHP